MDEALARYEHRRNEATMADYRENIAGASFNPMPVELLQLRAALRGNQENTRRFLMAREGLIPPKEFFNPENLERILGSAALNRIVPIPHESLGESPNV